ncbi:kinase [Novosphingobium sp. PhB165]|uniref:kinase n=1 Tax=Novosphingobium sp. PhB165 TaxID=2485105 RepID=UPI001048C9A7|nr:kinase [Novosphingobium sp. PhB165]
MAEIRGALSAFRHRPVVIGICGAQGSGKSTLAEAVRRQCGAEGLASAVLSLDDLYLTHAERQALSREVHPLLATRGVPGTHDIKLGLDVLDALESGGPAALPRFDKARDDRAPERNWPIVAPGCEVLVLEGWCVGAFPQRTSELTDPVNALEAEEDPDGRWRRWVNDMLGDSYQRLFARMDRLVLLAAPGFEVVQRWRAEQERDLAGHPAPGSKVMTEAEIARFIAHYERITRLILAEMPARADLVIRLDEARRPLEILRR